MPTMDYNLHLSPFSLAFFLSGCGEVNRFHPSHPSTTMFWVQHRSKAIKAANLGLKQWTKINLFSSKLIFKGIWSQTWKFSTGLTADTGKDRLLPISSYSSGSTKQGKDHLFEVRFGDYIMDPFLSWFHLSEPQLPCLQMENKDLPHFLHIQH